ncbi:hypothetical protein BCR43DRAFT_509264 [Syncephalastrum racemosum]|uniref:Uncharacterized protein n=1 Tax=Syncephalastrum racemosum TaxID=13706 RepID=A0A1X2GYS3_SYNRA|nr:hypothetical protein BCR43DRAFT_509329 [Syncephalastrum racemosum]ORY89501.1 hypothetical protein BCR43DRAFT_509264 [Syncephalastrum racemosum]
MCLSMRLYPSSPAPCITLRTRKIKTNRPPRYTSKQCCRSDAPLLVRLSRYKLLYAKWPIPESKICKCRPKRTNMLDTDPADGAPGISAYFIVRYRYEHFSVYASEHSTVWYTTGTNQYRQQGWKLLSRTYDGLIDNKNTQDRGRIIDVSSDALPGHTRKGSDLGMSGIGTAPRRAMDLSSLEQYLK